MNTDARMVRRCCQNLGYFLKYGQRQQTGTSSFISIKASRNVAAAAALLGAVLQFFVPGHLDGFEFGFVGVGGVAGEERELGDPFVHVGEADG